MLILFSLVVARVGGLFAGAPVLSLRGVPQRFKAAIILLVAAAVLPAIPSSSVPQSAYGVATAMVSEIAIGMSIGILARIFLTAFQMAGAMVAFQMGFAMAQELDPNTGVSIPIIGTIYLQMVTVMFLLLDGHHLLIRSLVASYQAFPLAATLDVGSLNQMLLSAGAVMYESGARIAGPVTGVMLLLNSLVGLLNRIVPQLSIFNIGLPLTVLGGLIAAMMSLPEVAHFFIRAYSVFQEQLAGVFMG